MKEPITLEYARVTDDREPKRWIVRRLLTGLFELGVTYGALLASIRLSSQIGTPLPFVLLGLLVLTLEQLPQNLGRAIFQLVIIFPNGRSVVQRAIRAVLIRPFWSAVCIGVTIALLADPATAGGITLEISVLIGLTFMFIDMVVFTATRERIGDHLTGAKEIRVIR